MQKKVTFVIIPYKKRINEATIKANKLIMAKSFWKLILFIVVISQLIGCGVREPDFPERPGRVVKVANEEELALAILNAESHETILIEDGIYILKQSLVIENKAHLTLRSSSGDSSKVVLQGDGWSDFYHRERKENDPADLIVIRNSEDIFIADLTIREVSHYGIKLDTETKAVKSNLKDINIFRCHFLNIGTRAFKGTAAKDRKHLVGGSVSYCIFENTKMPDTSWLYNGDYISAIDMMYLDNWVFSDNIFRNIRGANGGGRGAIFVWNQCRNIVVERNIFVGCDRSIAFGNPSEPTYYEPGTLHNYDGIIRNNFIVAGDRQGKGIEVVWADNIQVCNNTIYATDPEYQAIHYFQKISRLFIANNLVRGRIYGEGEGVLSEANLTGDMEGYFVNPVTGDLHLTKLAKAALGKGLQISTVSDDIDRQKRKKHPDTGADQR
ncbi:MAG: hypothetical protein A2X05_15785 [Bacteroidetes bacterium GWE2_41_25]|nr:MAG: hypothetical protein A2X05_15785 [Bacteroidetes bacterium GWE2_41_25]